MTEEIGYLSDADRERWRVACARREAASVGAHDEAAMMRAAEWTLAYYEEVERLHLKYLKSRADYEPEDLDRVTFFPSSGRIILEVG